MLSTPWLDTIHRDWAVCTLSARRIKDIATGTCVLILTYTLLRLYLVTDIASFSQSSNSGEGYNATHHRFHLLIPATQKDINLCKTIIGTTLLGYPAPTLIGWDKEDSGAKSQWLGGGSHMGKIFNTLSHLQSMNSSHDDDLALMVDAYDVWFQLPKDVLVNRFDEINRRANERLAARLGRTAVMKEGIRQTVVFGAGKRCAPNLLPSIACYPIPNAPLPDDLYFGNTDTDIGHNEWTSHKQRWLNSGFILGPVKDLRKILVRAAEEAKIAPKIEAVDDGQQGSLEMYHGSDQSVFARVWGQQEFQREVIRRRYGGPPDILQNPRTEHTPPTEGMADALQNGLKQESSDGDNLFEGPAAEQNTKSRHWMTHGKHLRSRGREHSLIKRGKGNMDALRPYDSLSPHFTHEPMEPLDGHPMELGIGIDYFSDLSHQTINSESDARWLFHNQSLPDQIAERTIYDCKWRLPPSLPADLFSIDSIRLLNQTVNPPQDPTKIDPPVAAWQDQNLYTHLCLGTIPVIIHHNGDKGARDTLWTNVWWQKHAKDVFEKRRSKAVAQKKKGRLQRPDWPAFLEDPQANTDALWGGGWVAHSGKFVNYDHICPDEWRSQLYG